MTIAPRWLVVGAEGQLGAALVRRLSDRAEVIALPRTRLDLTDHRAVMTEIERHRPTVVLNGAAYTAVDRAEDEPVQALAVNAFAVQSLARAAGEVGATLVHYSTDYVFDGHASTPYVETDQPRPQNVYGQTKLIGEWLAAEAPRVYALRVESLFGGPAAHSSIDKILSALRSGQPARVFVDRVVTPAFVDDVVEATWTLVAGNARPGLYHVVNSGETTWHGLALEMARQLGVAPQLVPMRVEEAKLRAVRPRYCALSNAKLAAAGFAMPTWQDALARYLAHASAA